LAIVTVREGDFKQGNRLQFAAAIPPMPLLFAASLNAAGNRVRPPPSKNKSFVEEIPLVNINDGAPLIRDNNLAPTR